MSAYMSKMRVKLRRTATCPLSRAQHLSRKILQSLAPENLSQIHKAPPAMNKPLVRHAGNPGTLNCAHTSAGARRLRSPGAGLGTMRG